MEQECSGLHEKVQYLTAQNKGLQTQLSETKRKHAESECKVSLPIQQYQGMWLSHRKRVRLAQLLLKGKELQADF